MWWLPIVEFFGRIALRIGVAALEKRYPGVKPVLDKVIQWLQGQAASGNDTAVQTLSEHVDKLCDSSVVGCAPQTKGLG